MPPPIYDQNAIDDLLRRTEYESWFLEEVYRITEKNLLPLEPLDSLVYPPDGGDGVCTTFGSINIDMGDWRPGFLRAGAPLIFVSTFKLLDMILEWVLVANGHAASFRFVEKIKALHGSVVFPRVIESTPWLRDRLVALYEQLEPLRGTIIHERHFQVIAGALHVSSSKRGSIGPQVDFSETDLRNLSLTLVSILRYLQGAWNLAEFQLKCIRRSLDELAHFHRLPALGQLPPGYLTSRIYKWDADTVVVDLDRIRRDVARFRPGQDTMFDVRVILISDDESTARAIRLPWHQLENAASPLSVTTPQSQALVDQVPKDVDVPLVAAALRR